MTTHNIKHTIANRTTKRSPKLVLSLELIDAVSGLCNLFHIRKNMCYDLKRNLPCILDV